MQPILQCFEAGQDNQPIVQRLHTFTSALLRSWESGKMHVDDRGCCGVRTTANGGHKFYRDTNFVGCRQVPVRVMPGMTSMGRPGLHASSVVCDERSDSPHNELCLVVGEDVAYLPGQRGQFRPRQSSTNRFQRTCFPPTREGVGLSWPSESFLALHSQVHAAGVLQNLPRRI